MVGNSSRTDVNRNSLVAVEVLTQALAAMEYVLGSTAVMHEMAVPFKGAHLWGEEPAAALALL